MSAGFTKDGEGLKYIQKRFVYKYIVVISGNIQIRIII